MTVVRDDRGVRIRRDGAGDGWAQAHRGHLGSSRYLQDVDALFGATVFGHNTADRLFLEYEPDDYQKRRSVLRRFAVVAMFDRKASHAAAFHEGNRLALAVYLYLCRTLAEHQPRPPKFFFVTGGQAPPWNMIEIDIEAGPEPRELRVLTLDSADWPTVWETLGLTALRNELRSWILSEKGARC